MLNNLSTQPLPNNYIFWIPSEKYAESDGWMVNPNYPLLKTNNVFRKSMVGFDESFPCNKGPFFQGGTHFRSFYSGGKNAFTHWWSLIMIWCTQTNKHIHWPRFQVEQFVIEIDKLNAIITSIEKEMVSLPGIYRGEGGVQEWTEMPPIFPYYWFLLLTVDGSGIRREKPPGMVLKPGL